MKTIFFNDIFTALKHKAAYAALFIILSFGFLSGFKFNMAGGKELTVNAPYSVGFMIGLLSLTIILISTLIAFSILFKEDDANFNSIIFSTPINKKEFAFSRFSAFYLLTLFGFFTLVLGYMWGLNYQNTANMNSGFNLWHYAYPFLIFGAVNSFLISSILFFIAQKFKNKLLVAITGLLLYILYMIALMYSNAPFMAQSLPQSLSVQRISALVDLFGLSGYFFEARDLSLIQRNTEVVPLSNFLLLNRMIIILFSISTVYFGVRSFLFMPASKKKSTKLNYLTPKTVYKNIPFSAAETKINSKTKWNAVLSFIKIDTIYIFKSIAFIAVSVLLLFYIGVEMFDDIDKGIRIPQQYASSGLLAQTINNSYYFIGALLLVYFVNDIFWRSDASNFSIIENTTYYSKEKRIGHTGSITVLIFSLTGLLILEAVLFQFIFNFPHIDLNAYLGVFVFNTFPLFLLSLFLLFINILCKNKTIALGISFLFFLLLATPIVKSIITNSLFRFLSGYNGNYSDFLGYGTYLDSFLWRLLFGLSIIGILDLIYNLVKILSGGYIKVTGILAFIVIAFISSSVYLQGYIPKDKESNITASVLHEEKYRKYQNIPQPTIKEVTTEIDLHPNEHFYKIRGKYIIKNYSSQAIDSLLINVPHDFEIQSLIYQYKDEIIVIDEPVSEIHLKQTFQPKDSASLDFEISYEWFAVNGHNSFNAIVENGSFMRISRYFPQFGYDDGMELSDVELRKEHGLDAATGIRSLKAPKEKVDDFINLDMIISTPINQVAIGTGELKKRWQDENRNYYNYKAAAIPFRFALSSADYSVKRVQHNGTEIKVFHHPLHHNNVDHLIENTKLSLDYCKLNFGPYPFQSVTFAEISSFTEGFAGTAYPGVIFMTEHMTFNANLSAENNQDVVNELAGHEVAHFWWGTNQIDPDYREGYAMLTESLAMYTEMMLYKKMYGKEKMFERLKIHQQIYENQKGLNGDQPLYKVTPENTHISYSKGAIVMVELSELIGEDKVNLALRNFLMNNSYPKKPTSLDLLNEFYSVLPNQNMKSKIEKLFK